MKGLEAFKFKMIQRLNVSKVSRLENLKDYKVSRAFSQVSKSKGSSFTRSQGSGSKNSTRTSFSQFQIKGLQNFQRCSKV